VRAGDVDQDDACRLADCFGSFLSLSSSERCEGSQQFVVPEGASLFFGSQLLGVRCWLSSGTGHRLEAVSRLSKTGVFEDYFALLADLSGTAHLVQMFDSTIRARPCIGGRYKRGRKTRHWDARVVAFRQKLT